MKRFTLTLVLAVVSAVVSAQTVTPETITGFYQTATVSLPSGGMVRWVSLGVDQSRPAYFSGACSLVREIASNGTSKTVGVDCSGPATVYVTTTGNAYYTCPGDGMQLESVHLTLRVNNITVYDKALFPPGALCYTTPTLPAVASFDGSTITFDNSAQDRDSLSTQYSVEGPTFLFSNIKDRIQADPGVTCGMMIRYVGTSRYNRKPVQVGTTCSTIAPAGEVLKARLQ